MASSPKAQSQDDNDTISKLHIPSTPINSTELNNNSTAWDSIKSMSISKQFHRLMGGKIPCERNSALLGIGTGGAVVAVGVIAQRSLKSSLNWGVGAAVFVTLAAFETCRSSRKAEKTRMKVIVEDFQRKRESEATLTK